MQLRRKNSPRERGSAVRITSARRSQADDLAARQRHYVISMAIRMVCVVGAVAVGPGWLRWVLIAGAAFLPYIAVVIANGTDQRSDPFDVSDDDLHRQLPGPPLRHEL